ncbi:MAG: hypothetical protein K0R54_426 [Clostridiaceae bacterium]|jgi:hypothetical protein|nr:hypothetical protein [Clostridiaceae bacterium]
MNKTEEFITQEKGSYGKVFSDIAFAIDNISGFLDSKVLENRKYIHKNKILSKYMELLDSAELELKKSGILGMFKGDKYIDLLKSYKNDNKESFEQLNNCSKCECLNCTHQCNFESCHGCISGAQVASCDRKLKNVVLHQNHNIRLTNNNTGEDDDYNVLALVEKCDTSKKFIILESMRTKEKFILYYYPGISEDSYGEITDENDFNFAAEAYDNLDA